MNQFESSTTDLNLPRFAVAVVMLFGCSAAAIGQDTGASLTADVEELVPILADPATDGRTSDIESSLNSLLQSVKRAQDEIVGSKALTKTPAIQESYAPLPSVTNTAEQRDRVSDLKKRIDLLRRLRRRDAMEQRDVVATPTTARNAISPAIPYTPRPPSRTAVQVQQPTLSAIQENLEPTVVADTAAQAEPKVVKAKQILQSPVDHLSLAESLYRTHNYQASLKTLQSIDTDLLNASDKTWMELLAALCQRRLGNQETAEAQLREISNAKIADRSVPLARWWLKQTEMSGTTKPTLTALSNDLDSLIERSKSHVQ